MALRGQGHKGLAIRQKAHLGAMYDGSKKKKHGLLHLQIRRGVGKTTNTVQIGAALAQRRKKVLIIDMNENAGATKHLGISVDSNLLGTFEILLGLENPIDLVISNDPDEGFDLPKNLDLLIGSRKLSTLEKASFRLINMPRFTTASRGR